MLAVPFVQNLKFALAFQRKKSIVFKKIEQNNDFVFDKIIASPKFLQSLKIQG